MSYWPLEESSGTVLHDTSIYGGDPVSETTSFASSLSWLYDADLEGRLLFSKHYQTTFDDLGDADRLEPVSLSCTGNCYYCGTAGYCKSCTLGMYLKNGVCVSSNSDTGFSKDLLEREFKPIKDPSITGLCGCDSTTCRKCSISSSLCDPPASSSLTYCVRNSLYYSATKNCYGTCPSGSYQSGTANTCTACSAANCVTCPSGTCTACETGYLLSSSGLCVSTVNCGNGLVEDPEACDDGNRIDGDGCSKYCQVEADFTCTAPTSAISVCTPKCGDGKFYGLAGEECDDGNLVSGDGCDSNCKIETNWWCENGSKTHPSECHCSPQHVASMDSFADNYMTLKLVFSRTLSLATAAGADLCATIFTASSVSLLGSTHSCLISGKAVVVSLGAGNTIYSGTALTILSGVLRADDSTCLQTFSGTVVAPTIPAQTVSGTMSLLALTPYCDEFTIWIKGVTGGLNRPYSSMVLTADSVTGGSSDDLVLSDKENLNWRMSTLTEHDASTYSVTLPAGVLLADVTYTLGLAITNFQGVVYQTTATFATTSKLITEMDMEGVDSSGAVTVEISKDLVIRTLPKLYKCGVAYPNISDIAVAYTQTSTVDVLNISAITMSSVADRLLHIPVGSMKAGVQYGFSVVCSSRGTGTILNSTTITISSVASSLEAIISPETQIVPANSALTLSGSKSYDRILLRVVITFFSRRDQLFNELHMDLHTLSLGLMYVFQRIAGGHIHVLLHPVPRGRVLPRDQHDLDTDGGQGLHQSGKHDCISHDFPSQRGRRNDLRAGRARAAERHRDPHFKRPKWQIA